MDRLKHLPKLPPRELALNAAAVTATLSAIIWCVRDYHEFLALGRGGAPYNVIGWAIVTLLRPFALSKRGAKQVSSYPADGAHDDIRDLPTRAGLPASVGGIVPHRQLSQHPPEEMKQYITNLFKNAVAGNSDILEERLSLYERHNPALFVHDNILSSADSAVPETARIARGEIGHIHPDFSIHLYLSPADARLIIEKGWGEKHRLSKPENSLFKFKRFHIADTYILIYGPRDEEEIEVVRKILQSSIRFMTGRSNVELSEWRTALSPI
ncbi:hypothetical protein G647_06647 [Cladophialophora carrionii CBS 160.54]|uniref:Luciferase domain-containing protein n=1 Tax=Cladophialophora carrionii CBS 160.54 TaxID=1279043 RepID=V9D7E4_9EURO|nr:uncharacterized protein G647_06647 [Cladophialophora carrionii CBS 160.54]ETI22571.1 hypothetical protein G647_06647 [Cladophialophora carrionii CBS 160.54]